MAPILSGVKPDGVNPDGSRKSQDALSHTAAAQSISSEKGSGAQLHASATVKVSAAQSPGEVIRKVSLPHKQHGV